MDLQTALDAFQRRVVEPLTVPFSADDRLHWTYLAAALVIALAATVDRAQARGEPTTWRAVLGWLFRREVWWHPSARVDYAFFAVDAVLFAALVAPWLATSGAGRDVGRALAGLVLAPGAAGAPSWPLALGLTAALVVASDFGLWLVHWLQHRVPFLWAFHSVHHSAEVMTPVTVFRVHPVDTAFNLAVTGFLAGVVSGAAGWASPEAAALRFPGALNALTFLFYVGGYALRHSEVWVDWGPTASRVLVSPAMHQVHHSADPRHWDTNLGFMLAVWDRLAGTLWVPQGRLELTFGLGAGRAANHGSVVALYVQPFVDVFKGGLAMFRSSPASQVTLVLVVSVALGVAWRSAHAGPPAGLVGVGPADDDAPAAGRSVFLADLTWMEVAERLRGGTTTVIVPTGGLEQNGPHMVMGKHDAIVAFTARRIAEELGDVLVAPVVGYVPEGDLEPPSLHMRWPGTISVKDEVFGAVLEEAARSLKLAGFRTICFLGDSYGNQPAQARVAAALTAAWRQDDVRVVQLDRYYEQNGQVEWLREQGETEAAIGGHAGIRDTSELLFVRPAGVRLERAALEGGGGGPFERTGCDGDPTRASAERGRALLQLKVDAAVKQVRALRSAP